MMQFTVRGISEEVEKIVRTEAEIKGISINKAFISVIEEAAGIKKKKRKELCHDLDHLCGILAEDEGNELINNINLQRKIDKELWEIRE